MRRLWNIEEFPFHPEKILHHETIFSIGNGYLSTRASFEEDYAGQTPATLIHGVYNHVPGALVPELVNAPNWLPITIRIDGTLFHLNAKTTDYLYPPRGALLGYRRTLHIDEGLLRREVLFRAKTGSVVRLVFERFASLSDQHVLAQRVQLFAVDGNPEIVIESSLDGTVTNAGNQHWGDFQVTAKGSIISIGAKTQQSGYRLGMASKLIAPGKHKAKVKGLQPTVMTAFTLKQQETITVDKFTTVFTSRDTHEPLTAAQKKADQAAKKGYDALLSAHRNEWAKYWRDSDIQIMGDDNAQLSLRFAMYHILIAAPRHDQQVSIGAKTLSGLGYKGHVFWDTELFILPPLTLTQPHLARNLLMYRYNKLLGARHKAQANGYEGAMFPWESTDTGEETTPQWSDVQPDGSRIRIWTGDSEQHISTDIAFAVLQYWRWTGDDEFLRSYGAEIFLDTAVFWGSRVEAKNGRYEISQQIGPDEYHENIDNSVFTNRMVVWHLQRALEMVDWLKAHAPNDHQRLVTALKLTPERLNHWRDIIAKMYIPFDHEKQIHIQFPGFFDMEYIPVPLYEPRTASVQAILGHKRSIQTQVIKQADVVMLMALLGDELGASREVILNNWNTYYPRTDHGSSLSPSMHTWVAARLGLSETAYELFQHAAEIDLKDNKGNVRDGIHGAACGGLIQAVLFGMCGLHIDADGKLKTAPHLPEHWQQVSFHVYYRGRRRAFRVKNPVKVSPSA
ncbi:MAG: glycoside hydrolase family 65 protein [Chloroflexi bacterium]|nr:glycoside hydrolase family 65 protein [Chloroflexota bacterium]